MGRRRLLLPPLSLERPRGPVHARRCRASPSEDRRETALLLGRIAAGRGVEAVVNEEAYALAAELINPRSSRRRFLLEAKGESMTGAGIEEGDLLVIEENPSPPNGAGSRP